MAAIPLTINGLSPFDVISALQKHIRRGEERQAMACACELGHTSKSLFSMLCNRLEIISHEDIGLADMQVVYFVGRAIEQARRFYGSAPEKHGPWRMIIGNAIMALCRAWKSREADHFQAAVGVAAEMYGTAPKIPDYAYDHHTQRGRQMGRGLDHFRESSAKLHPPAGGCDEYEEEAYAVWREWHRRGKKKAAPRKGVAELPENNLFDKGPTRKRTKNTKGAK